MVGLGNTFGFLHLILSLKWGQKIGKMVVNNSEPPGIIASKIVFWLLGLVTIEFVG